MPLEPGQTLSFYEILSPLGAGGMGEVYRARDTRLGRQVAIKVLPVDLAEDEERHRRFEREARVLASLNDTNVAGIHGVGEDSGVYFLALELVDGEDLATRLMRGHIHLDEALDLCRQLASGLEAAHEAGVVHRDLKPSNVRITSAGTVKVLDFGLAKPFRRGPEPATPTTGSESAADDFLMTEEGLVLGTPIYMSPEQARGQVVDRRTDVWSFGCVLYECLTGARAFGGASFADLVAAIVGKEPDWSRLPVGLPDSIRRLAKRCLEKDPRERLRDVGEARVVLERAARRGEGERPESSTAWGGARASVQRRFVLRTEHVRRLDNPIPRMIGDAQVYLDNERDSDTLVAFLPGLGLDETLFLDILDQLPCRAVAMSLFGFSPTAHLRPALSLEDHYRLLSDLFTELERLIRPRRIILVGFSAGADLALGLLASAASENLSFDALLLLSPAAHSGMQSISRTFASLPRDPEQIVPVLKALGGSFDTLEDWLSAHDYFVQAFRKFGERPEILSDHARRLIELSEREPEFFFRSLRHAISRVTQVECVFAAHETADVDWILQRHLEDDVLGPNYREEMISLSSVGHLHLAESAVMRPYLDALISEA
ncbi:MAG: serine/threonine protein kinase/pimeloyl-ACP methyl ester carboxylesterase [Paracoccaceae bacterium]|jgi:serine/threonine protein kinase/pimeloyl-ACP methyl ester carboxylesterase